MHRPKSQPSPNRDFLSGSILSPAALVIIAWVILDRAVLLAPLTGADYATFMAFVTLTLLAVATRGEGHPKS